MRMRMEMTPQVFLAQNCTECGRPMSKPENALGPEEQAQITLMVDKSAEAPSYKTCPKCGKAVVDEEAGDAS